MVHNTKKFAEKDFSIYDIAVMQLAPIFKEDEFCF